MSKVAQKLESKKAGRKSKAAEKAVGQQVVEQQVAPAFDIEKEKRDAEYYCRLRKSRKQTIPQFKPEGHSDTSDDALAMMRIACHLLKQKLDAGEVVYSIPVSEMAAIVRNITSVDPIGKDVTIPEEAFKQGEHRISKIDTKEIRVAKVSGEIFDAFAFGRLSDGFSPFCKNIYFDDEGNKKVPRYVDARLYWEPELLDEYLEFVPTHDELVRAAWRSIRKYCKKHGVKNENLEEEDAE